MANPKDEKLNPNPNPNPSLGGEPGTLGLPKPADPEKERFDEAEGKIQDTTADRERQERKAKEEAEAKKDDPKQMKEALKAYGLKREHVLDFRLNTDAVTGKQTLILVTRGGRKVTWPDEEGKAGWLSDEEKDGIQRKATPRFFNPVTPGGPNPGTPPAPGSGVGRN